MRKTGRKALDLLVVVGMVSSEAGVFQVSEQNHRKESRVPGQ
jgi:hypothetical protein